MVSSAWEADELSGYERLSLTLPPEGDGPLSATLVRRTLPGPRPERAILYLHGFTDYFFQTHVADAFAAAELDFYALDLRRYGRSLDPANHPFQCKRLDDYFEEVSWALEIIAECGGNLRGISSHSTGCLITALYLARGKERARVPRVVMNSPFLAFRANAVESALLRPVGALGKLFPLLRAPVGLDAVYGRSLHKSASGEWDYDLIKKPLAGYGVTCGWIRVIANGHKEAQNGLQLPQEILVQHSLQSHRPKKTMTPRDQREDIVLDVAHMRRFGPQLGPHVTLSAHNGGLHDLTLSREPVRSEVIAEQIEFLNRP